MDIKAAPSTLTAAVACACLTDPRDQGSCHVDLSSATWLDPSGLVAVACFVEHRLRSGDDVSLVRPLRGSVARYASASGLGDVLDDLGVEHNLPRVDRRDPDTVLQLQRFERAEGAQRLAEHVMTGLGEEYPAAAEALALGLIEAGANVTPHGREDGGFIAAQDYPANGGLVFAVGDCGVGMLAALRGRGAESHGDAIRMALAGQSSLDGAGRGLGLTSIWREVAQLDGKLAITTGDTSVTSTTTSQVQAMQSRRLSMPGVTLRGEVQKRT